MTQLNLFPTPDNPGYKLASTARAIVGYVRSRVSPVLVIVCLLVGSGLLVRHFYRAAQAARCEAATAQASTRILDKARRADTAALGTSETIKGSIAAEELKNRGRTTEALEANPDWAGQPVPDAVADSLRQ